MKQTFETLESVKKELSFDEAPAISMLQDKLMVVYQLITDIYDPAINPIAATVVRGGFGLKAFERLETLKNSANQSPLPHPEIFIKSELLTILSLLLVSIEMDFNIDADSLGMTA